MAGTGDAPFWKLGELLAQAAALATAMGGSAFLFGWWDRRRKAKVEDLQLENEDEKTLNARMERMRDDAMADRARAREELKLAEAKAADAYAEKERAYEALQRTRQVVWRQQEWLHKMWHLAMNLMAQAQAYGRLLERFKHVPPKGTPGELVLVDDKGVPLSQPGKLPGIPSTEEFAADKPPIFPEQNQPADLTGDPESFRWKT